MRDITDQEKFVCRSSNGYVHKVSVSNMLSEAIESRKMQQIIALLWEKNIIDNEDLLSLCDDYKHGFGIRNEYDRL